jgi:hypothetical protein
LALKLQHGIGTLLMLYGYFYLYAFIGGVVDSFNTISVKLSLNFI